jgi:hypothetical protein
MAHRRGEFIFWSNPAMAGCHRFDLPVKSISFWVVEVTLLRKSA